MNIFLIEDDLDDIELLEEALKKFNVSYSLNYVNDGSAAIDYIHSPENIPDIIVLDMNLPKVHGRDVILKIKSSDKFKNIPLLILTTSSAKEDMDYSYKNGADKYLIKPGTMDEIKKTIDIIINLAGSK